MGKRVLRLGGLGLTHEMLARLDIRAADEVVEFAPDLGLTARAALERKPASYIGAARAHRRHPGHDTHAVAGTGPVHTGRRPGAESPLCLEADDQTDGAATNSGMRAVFRTCAEHMGGITLVGVKRETT